jgi:hypothetical protein
MASTLAVYPPPIFLTDCYRKYERESERERARETEYDITVRQHVQENGIGK